MSTNSTQRAQLQFLNNQGNDVIQSVAPGGSVQFAINALGGIQVVPQIISASGAVSPFISAVYVITKAGVAALTIAAPTAGVDDGNEVTLISTTAFAHTLTATGLLKTGTAAVNVATFAAFAGAGVTLTAYQGLWYVTESVAITFS